MDSYDPALIFDLAAGLLPADQARAAEAALSPEGQAELAAQRAVLAAIADLDQPQMTDIERARMHRGVAAGMVEATREMPAIAAAGAPVRSPSRPRSVMWMRFASAAAAAALFAGVVAVGSQLVADGGDDATADPARTEMNQDASAGAELTTTTAAASFGSDRDSDAELGSDGSAADALGGGDAAEAAPGEEAGLAQLEEAPRLEAPPAESDLGELEDFAIRMMETQRFDDGLSSLPCYDVAVEDDDLEIVASFRAPYPGADGEELFAIAFSDAGTATSDPLIRLYDPATCEPLADTTGSP